MSMKLFMQLCLVGTFIALGVSDGLCDEPKRLKDRDRQVISDLIESLDKPGIRHARLDAVMALNWIGSPAREAVPKLLTLLKDAERETSPAAAAAILEIGADHPLVGPALVAALNDANPGGRN